MDAIYGHMPDIHKHTHKITTLTRPQEFIFHAVISDMRSVLFYLLALDMCSYMIFVSHAVV